LKCLILRSGSNLTDNHHPKSNRLSGLPWLRPWAAAAAAVPQAAAEALAVAEEAVVPGAVAVAELPAAAA
jgi:hypothetical protein